MQRICSFRHHHKVFVARAAPSASAESFAQPISACTRHEAPRDELGMLDEVRGVADHARHQDRVGRQLHLFPDIDLVLVPHVRRFERNRSAPSP
jgi:hypothetical protein